MIKVVRRAKKLFQYSILCDDEDEADHQENARHEELEAVKVKMAELLRYMDHVLKKGTSTFEDVQAVCQISGIKKMREEINQLLLLPILLTSFEINHDDTVKIMNNTDQNMKSVITAIDELGVN